MKVTFLREAGGRLLSKEFKKVNGVVEASNYYQHYNKFSSFEEQVLTIEDLHAQMNIHAAQGHSVVKGNYVRPLVDESRAGLIDKTQPTQWLCLDFDGAAAVDPTAVLTPLGMGNVDHVVQYSASHGVKPGLRAHVFLLLDSAVPETMLKQWLMWLNLTNPLLRSSMELTKTGNSLKWPLDISLAESHRIIYIAPPKFEAMEDPFAEGQVCGHLQRIMLTKGSLRSFSITSAIAQADLSTVNTLKDAMRDELRAKAGLRRKKEVLKHVAKHNVYVQSNPDTATVTGIKRERGFVYLNINGGDSWGYFHPEHSFEVVQNFKGEPAYLTKDLLPDYYTECVAARKQEAAKQSDLSDTAGKKYFYFTEKQSGAYYKGEWDPSTETRVLSPARSREQISDFCIQHGLNEPAFIPVMETIFSPIRPTFFDKEAQTVNLYQPTTYRINAKAGNADKAPPDTVEKILRHVTGDDEEAYSLFVNWLAYIWQYGKKPKIAWVLHGTTGTGKGVLMNQILQPLFGLQQALEITHEPLSERFNGYLRRAQIIAIDEADTDGMPNVSAIAAKLKNWITEDELAYREMQKGVYNASNYTAFIIFSNRQNPVLIDLEDRRFNVAPRQERKLLEILGGPDFRRIPKELQGFADYLTAYDVDVRKATQPYDNAAKRSIQLTTTSSPEDVVHAFKRGNFSYFVDLLPSGLTSSLDSVAELTKLSNYKKVLEHVYDAIVTNSGSNNVRIGRDDIAALFGYALGWSMTPTKFTKTCRKFGLELSKMRVNNTPQMGFETIWEASDEDLEAYRALLTPQASQGVTPMRPKREEPQPKEQKV